MAEALDPRAPSFIMHLLPPSALCLSTQVKDNQSYIHPPMTFTAYCVLAMLVFSLVFSLAYQVFPPTFVIIVSKWSWWSCDSVGMVTLGLRPRCTCNDDGRSIVNIKMVVESGISWCYTSPQRKESTQKST